MGNVQLTNKLQLGTAALFSPGKLLLVINCDTGSFFKVFLSETLLTPRCVLQSFLSTSWEAFCQTGGRAWPHFGHVFPVPFRFQPTDCSWLSHSPEASSSHTDIVRSCRSSSCTLIISCSLMLSFYLINLFMIIVCLVLRFHSRGCVCIIPLHSIDWPYYQLSLKAEAWPANNFSINCLVVAFSLLSFFFCQWVWGL